MLIEVVIFLAGLITFIYKSTFFWQIREFFINKNIHSTNIHKINVKVSNTPDELRKGLMFVKHFAEAPGYSRLANRLGETVPTHDGKGSTITEMNTGIRNFTQVVEMTEYQEVYDAMMGNYPILGRTSYTTLRGEEEIDVVLEYPITVMNARHKHDTWQIDTGLILVPDFSIECKLEVGIFRRAYIVYNKWDYAEHVMELPDKVEEAVFPIVQLTDPKPLAPVVHNQLFVVKIV